MAIAIENPPANAGDIRDVDLIPGSGRSPGEREMATDSRILAWKISWTEEPGGIQSMGHKEWDVTEGLGTGRYTMQMYSVSCFLGLLSVWYLEVLHHI